LRNDKNGGTSGIIEAQGKDINWRHLKQKGKGEEEKDTINLHSIVTHIPPEESIDNFCFRQQTTTISEQNYNTKVILSTG